MQWCLPPTICPFPFPTSSPFIYSYFVSLYMLQLRVYLSPHQHCHPRPVAVVLPTLPPFPSRPDDPSEIAYIDKLCAKWRPEWSQRLFGIAAPSTRLSALGTMRLSVQRCLPPPDLSGRCLLYRGAQSFPPREWRVCSCVRRRTPVPDERSGCACAPRKWKPLIRFDPRFLPACGPLAGGSA